MLADRSGSKGVGAVAVVGNFRSYDTVGVFRTDLPADVKQGQGLIVEQATDVFLGPQKAAVTLTHPSVFFCSSRVHPGFWCDVAAVHEP